MPRKKRIVKFDILFRSYESTYIFPNFDKALLEVAERMPSFLKEDLPDVPLLNRKLFFAIDQHSVLNCKVYGEDGAVKEYKKGECILKEIPSYEYNQKLSGEDVLVATMGGEDFDDDDF